MLLFCLLAFGLMGIVARNIVGSRMPVILLLSAGSIALISPASLLVCLATAALNFLLLKGALKKPVFIFSVVINVLLLLAYHSYPGLYKNLNLETVLVILGFSYLSLQQIAYLCSVYFRQEQAPANFLHYITAVLYLPKFFSGPIASLPAVSSQLDSPAVTQVSSGLNRILLGLFKKLVLAESLAPMVHSVFDFDDAYPGLTLVCGALLYSLQLYFDFSGYSDIAVGVSGLWGISLPENFNFPFRQKSWSTFWKSWHSSLTNWLWQYVFNPLYLALSRRALNKKLILLVCAAGVFSGMAFFNGVQSGFWISAGIFAALYFGEQVFGLKENYIRQPIIFLLFSFALLYFRQPAYEDYAGITKNLLTGNFLPENWLAGFFAPLASGGSQHDYFNLGVSLALCFLFLLFERKLHGIFSQSKINFAAWFILLALLFTWGVFESGERFIYMQF